MSTKKELERKAQAMIDEANTLLDKAEKLRAKASSLYEYPPEPGFTAGSIDVRFPGDSNTYRRLVYMPTRGGSIYTTGRDKYDKVFSNWREFVDWLHSDDIVWHNRLFELQFSGDREVEIP